MNRSQLALVALQECRLGEGQLPPQGYTLLLRQGWSPGGEAALLIRNNLFLEAEIVLKTGLYAAVLQLAWKRLTVYSLYCFPLSQFRNFL
ncbi:hypothetical protein PoB_004153400 [Plakobranchus ocellatus]|uniref:Uncharacterized protein n=1 Tax=Plakobranchus ocellatus TaxID=259542 RepID=A0AAV4B9J1_9GAST|nr:hypothetical protein PoB_004153400 [Plakobranchus ocellatus]